MEEACGCPISARSAWPRSWPSERWPHKMKPRRGFLPAGPHRSRHHHSQYIRGKQICREHKDYVGVDCGISRARWRATLIFLRPSMRNWPQVFEVSSLIRRWRAGRVAAIELAGPRRRRLTAGRAPLAAGAVAAPRPAFSGGSIRAVVGEDQRLLEADRVGRGVAVGERFSLDLIEPPLVKENRDRGSAAVRAQNAELPAEHAADPGRNINLDLAVLRQRRDRMVDH